MLRSILSIVDTTPGSEAATNAALQMAQATGATLGVTSMLDLFWAMRNWHQPLIGLEIALELDRITGLFEAQTEAVERLVSKATALGIATSRIRTPSHPEPAFAVFSHAYDVVVIPQDAAFHLEVEPHVRDAAVRVCCQLVRPVLVVPPTPASGEGVVLGYDGSASASRAMHISALLGLALEPPVRVVSIRPDVQDARTLAETGAALLRRHGAQVEVIALEESVHEGKQFLTLIEESPPARLVIGTTGHSAWRDALLGSTTSTLFQQARVPLLVGA